MESLSRRNNLPASFSGCVFSPEDYREIFGGSRCSIPVLDLSALDGAGGRRGKEIDYDKIFGGDDGAESEKEVFDQRTPAKTASHSDRPSPLHTKKEGIQNGAPDQSLDGTKQYTTFYNRTSQGSKNGENGTTHVAHIRAVPGFTLFIDENLQKTGDKFENLPKDKMRPSPKVSVDLDKKKTTDGTEKIRNQSSCDRFFSPDKNVDANGSSLKTHSFKLSSPTLPARTASETKRSRELNFNVPKSGAFKIGPNDCSPSSSDEELDVDSAAAVCAAALRKALREAEASIRIAKEIMERKKNGFQKLPKPRSKEGLEMKKKNLEKASIQATKTEKVAPNLKEIEKVRVVNEGVRETNDAKSNSYDDVQEHITKLERKKARRSGKSSPNFIQSAENCVAQNVCGKGNESQELFHEILKTGNPKTATVELENPKGSNTRLFVNNLSGKVNENRLENSADYKAPGQFPDLVTTENQRKEVLEMGDTDGCTVMLSVHNISGKVTEDMLEASADSKPLRQFPELVKTETANLELEHKNGNNNMSSAHNVCVKVKGDKLELSADSKTQGQFPELVKTVNQRTSTLELGHTNECNGIPSAHSFFEKENEKSVDSKALGQFPELVKTDNHRAATLELGHANDSNIMQSVHRISEKENDEKVETFADSKELHELVKTDNQSTATLELGHKHASKVKPAVHSFSEKENEEKLETFADYDSEELPELVKTDNQSTATLEMGHKHASKVKPFVRSLSEKENEEKLETFADSDSDSEELPELVKTDNQSTATLEMRHKHASKVKPSVHSFSANENEEKLEAFADSDSEELPELVKTDNQSTATLEMGHTHASKVKPAVHSFSEKVNVEMFETSADSKALGKFPELVKTDNQRTAVLDLEHTNGSNVRPSVHNVPIKVDEDKFEPSADPTTHKQFPELVKKDNQRTATLEFRHNGNKIVPPVQHTNECGEMEKQTDEGTLELLERHSKEVHRKRKQWKDFEGKPSDIKIAEDGGQSLHNTTAEEVHEHEERTLERLEGHSKEIYRKRRQWKDVEVKPYDIKIADDGEKCIHGQDNREKVTHILDNNDVEDTLKTSSSEESYENEVVKSQEQEKVEGFESLNVKTCHGEELDEAQKWVENEKIKDCSEEPEITRSLAGVHEEKESVKHMCKKVEIEAKLQESSEWRDYEVAFEVESNISGENDDKDGEMINDNGTTDAWKEDGSEHLGDCQVTHKQEGDDNDITSEGSERMSDASQSSIDFKEDFSFDEEEPGKTSEVFQSCEFEGFETGSRYAEMAHVQGQTQTCMTNQEAEEPTEATEFNDDDSGSKQTEFDGTDSELDNNQSAGIEASVQKQEENDVFDLETSVPGKQVEMESRIEASQLPNLFKGEEKTRGVYEQERVIMINRKEEKLRGTDEVEEETAKESRQKEVRAEKEQLERFDEISKREREREKNRMVVERAIREARERAFAEARERAERAAVEKATAEARERVMAEARQKFEKTNTATKSSTDKALLQAKLRSERAAVERAHAEARERALEKALSQKSNVPSSKLDGNNVESAERRNARLEKTQRTMERAAKALAEKNMRDLLAQREQAERHRLAETLDAEIKRWSSGKTRNLRALLSTLQYILGPDSGWQPVSLTEIVTTSNVKKAYRKATLHVHPDKLQQRGASIQQKYICEKVFDLLKAAWNRFHSEER